MLCARTEKLDLATMWTSLAICMIGGTLRHNAGCCWNDICDVELDRQVGEYSRTCEEEKLLTCVIPSIERSKSRPLASGAVSLAGAVLLLAAHYATITWLLQFAGPEGCASSSALNKY